MHVLVDLMLSCALGNPIPMEATIREHDLELTSVRDYARSAVGDLRPAPAPAAAAPAT